MYEGFGRRRSCRMKAQDRSVEQWFVQLGLAAIQLPRFQRFEAWGHRDVESLLETVLDGLPAGAALVLQVSGTAQFKYRPLATAPEAEHLPQELLLDGQQRLTALWRSLTDSYEDRMFFVKLDSENDEGGTDVISQRRHQEGGRSYPMWATSPEQTLQRNLIPISLLRPGAEAESELEAWLEKATEGDFRRSHELYKLANRLRVQIATFNLPYLFLEASTQKSTVLDVFVKMNTRLVKLTAFDIIVAEIEGDTGESLHDLVAGLKGQVPGLARYADVEDVVLDIAALLQDRPIGKAGYFGVRWTEIVENWEFIVTGCRRATEFLEQERIPDMQRLPTSPTIAPLVALWAHAPEQPDRLGNVRVLFRQFLWRAFCSDRYEVAANSRILQDYRPLLQAVQTGETTADAPIFEDPLPDAAELLGVGWPKRRDRLARAVLLLSLRGGALDLADGAELTPLTIGRREYHHLFPKAYLERQGMQPPDIDNALNCALITWRTNRTISSTEPLQYLLDRAEAATLGEQDLKYRLMTHSIPFEPLAANDYETFKAERAEALAAAIKQLCDGHEWNPMLAHSR